MVHWGTEDCVPPLPHDDTDAAWRGHLIDWAGVVGLSSVKEDNVEEWYWRLQFLSETLGWEAAALCYGDGKGGHRKEFITLPIIRRGVGLWTNWSNVKRVEWVKLRVQRITETCDRRVRRQLEDEKEQPVTAKAAKKKRKVKA
jgi:hypothetical protein